METLILSPPVTVPSEPPAGAFVLAATLAGRGVDSGLLDLSLELYHREIDGVARQSSAVRSALAGLIDRPEGYDPEPHQSALGHLHHALGAFDQRHPGWKLTLMDLTPPGGVHAPGKLAAMLAADDSPFAQLWQEVLDPVLDTERPRRVVVSVAYLSQLAATLDLVAHLDRRGITALVGGSLIRSLHTTGAGLAGLRDLGLKLDPGDGASLIPADGGAPLDRLAWPRLLSNRPYLSSRPVLPLPLSSGCYWRQCLFCPDRKLPHSRVPLAALAGLLDSLPASIVEAGPVLHLIDSAVPPGALERALPLFRDRRAGFYGFARPTKQWLTGDRLGRCAEAGGLMLQLGIESGSPALLARYQKGIVPDEAEAVLAATAEAGMRTYLYLLFGLPGERPEDREATGRLLVRQAGAVDFLNLSLFNLPRHCEMNDRAAELGIEPEPLPEGDGDELRLYQSFRYRGGSPREEAREFLKGRLRRTPEVRAAIRRTPRWLRAAHLALLRLPGRREPR